MESGRCQFCWQGKSLPVEVIKLLLVLLGERAQLGVSVLQRGLVLLFQAVQALAVRALQLLHLLLVRHLCLGMLLDNTLHYAQQVIDVSQW